jgi:hypothetical protein
MDTGAVIPSCAADAIQARRDAIVGAAETVARLLSAAPEGFPRLYVDHRGSRTDFSLEHVTRDADAAAWDTLLRESGLWSFMDKTARDQWREQINGEYGRGGVGKLPPIPVFTVDAARDFAARLHSERLAMVSRGVAEVHRKLSPDYRSNEVGRFGPRLVITRLGAVWGKGKWLHICHTTADVLDDLARFLYLARGLPEPDHRQGAYRLLSAAADSAPALVSMDWWTVRLFKNGNGHLVFKHAEDVDRLNRLLAVHGAGTVADDTRRRQ